jgi:hypothetical protein
MQLFNSLFEKLKLRLLYYKNKISKFFSGYTGRIVGVIVALTLLAAGAIYVTFNFLESISALATVTAFTALGISLVFALDYFILKELDTIDEIKKGNLSYAIFFLGICLIIAAAILAS